MGYFHGKCRVGVLHGPYVKLVFFFFKCFIDSLRITCRSEYDIFWSYSGPSLVLQIYSPSFHVLYFFFLRPIKSDLLDSFPGAWSALLASHLMKTNSPSPSCYQLPIVLTASSSQLGVGALCPPSPSVIGFCVAGVCTGLLHVVTVTLSSYVQLLSCIQKHGNRFPCIDPQPLAHTVFFFFFFNLLFPNNPWALGEEGVM